MKFPLPANIFPTLVLTPADKRKIEEAAKAVVKKTIEQYHKHLTVRNGVVDEKRWKKIKEREDVRVYRERKASVDEIDDRSSSSQSSSDANESADEQKVIVPMLTFGSIQGNLDDVMYGALNPTTEEMQLKTMYVEDGMKDWSLLASIVKPSEQNPFRELNIKWAVKSHPRLVGIVMRTRDAVYIESTGIALTPSGERIGYHMFHSVDIPEIHDLQEFDIVRVKASVGEFFRQRKPNCVEVYGRCMLNPMGAASARMAGATIAEAAIAVCKYMHCAEMKKLTRIMSSGAQDLARSTASVPSVDSKYSVSDFTRESTSSMLLPPASSAKQCVLCSESVGGGLSFANSKEKYCRICAARICARCRVYKTIYLPTEVEKELKSVEMAFCTRCIQIASCASSAKFAVLDAFAAEGKAVDYSDALQ